MRAIVDSIKGSNVKCLLENGDLITLKKKMLPEGIGEGDVVRMSFELDQDATKRQKEIIATLKGQEEGR